MLFSLIAVGRARAGPEKTLYEHYRARLRSPLDLIELDLKKPIEPVDKRRAAEAELIIAAIPAGSVIIALDERGKQLNSRDFASLIGAWQYQGERHISHGLDQTIRNQSRTVLSYGAATWPHMLVRAMVAEQLYRAQTILDGHPYHRD